VLVHGFLGDKTTNWQTYGPLLKNNGYCVFALTYGGSPSIPAPYNQALGGLNPIRRARQRLARSYARF